MGDERLHDRPAIGVAKRNLTASLVAVPRASQLQGITVTERFYKVDKQGC